jgi:hypothetical protein
VSCIGSASHVHSHIAEIAVVGPEMDHQIALDAWLSGSKSAPRTSRPGVGDGVHELCMSGYHGGVCVQVLTYWVWVHLGFMYVRS